MYALLYIDLLTALCAEAGILFVIDRDYFAA